MADFVKSANASVAPQFENFKKWFKNHGLTKVVKDRTWRTVNQKWADPQDHSKGRVACDPYKTLRFTDAKGNFVDENGKAAKDGNELILKVAKKTAEANHMAVDDFNWNWVADNIDNLVIGKVTSLNGNTGFVLALSTEVVEGMDMSLFE